MQDGWIKRVASVSGGAIAAGAFGAPAADAANFEVKNLADSGTDSLRDAVDQANATAGADTVTFQSGVTGTIGLTTGEIYISDSVAITGPGATQLAVSGGASSRVFNALTFSGSISVSISGLTVRDGNASGGAGVYGYNTELSLSAVTVSGNDAVEGDGGGVATRGSNSSISVVDSTVSNNTATPGVESGGLGGGIYRGSGPMEIVNSTISGNSAIEGGGIYSGYSAGTSDIRSSTIVGNGASEEGGGIYRSFSQSNTNPVNLDSTIVASNTASTGPELFESDTLATSRFTAGFSLIEDPTGATIVDSPGINIFGADPALGGLAANGGPTETHLPSSGSPALDKGLSPGLASDQRGAARVSDDAGIANAPGGDGSDIGSVEVPEVPAVGAGAAGVQGQVGGQKSSGRFCLGQRATIIGTIKKDKIQGTPGPDVIRGMRGADRISGLGGDDVICGDRGEDTIFGNEGDDHAKGGTNADKVRGQAGNDLLRGGSGVDRIFGGAGNDTMFGGAKEGTFQSGGATGRDSVGNNCDGGEGDDAVAGCENVQNVP